MQLVRPKPLLEGGEAAIEAAALGGSGNGVASQEKPGQSTAVLWGDLTKLGTSTRLER